MAKKISNSARKVRNAILSAQAHKRKEVSQWSDPYAVMNMSTKTLMNANAQQLAAAANASSAYYEQYKREAVNVARNVTIEPTAPTPTKREIVIAHNTKYTPEQIKSAPKRQAALMRRTNNRIENARQKLIDYVAAPEGENKRVSLYDKTMRDIAVGARGTYGRDVLSQSTMRDVLASRDAIQASGGKLDKKALVNAIRQNLKIGAQAKYAARAQSHDIDFIQEHYLTKRELKNVAPKIAQREQFYDYVRKGLGTVYGRKYQKRWDALSKAQKSYLVDLTSLVQTVSDYIVSPDDDDRSMSARIPELKRLIDDYHMVNELKKQADFWFGLATRIK